jgi:ActR/RegA family two-component response regulator
MALVAGETDNVIDESVVAMFATKPAVAAPQEQSLRELQRTQLRSVYAETGGNISETARRLGVCRNTVYRALEDNAEQ